MGGFVYLKEVADLLGICQPGLHQRPIRVLLPVIPPEEYYLSHVPVVAVQDDQVRIPPMLLLEDF